MWLFFTDRIDSFDRLDQSSGSEPMRLLSEQSNVFKLVIKLKLDGKVPVSPLPSKEMCSRVERLQSESGIRPERLLS